MSTVNATAENAAASSAATEEKPKRKMKFRNKLLLIVTSLALMALMRTGFLFVLVAMMPSIVTYYMDRKPRMFMFKTIFACNLSGALPFIAKLLHYGPAGVLLQETIHAPGTWIIVYGSAFAGYMLISTAPLLAHFIIGNFHSTQVMRLERAQKKIEQEWGEEVTRLGREEKH